MADDKRGREKQAADKDRRQRERAMEEAVERGEEAAPEETAYSLEDITPVLEQESYPITAATLVDRHGDRTITTSEGDISLQDVLSDVSDEIYESPDAVRDRIDKSLRRQL